jgi:transcriptional regulator with XRE-family HTH domain
MDASALDTRKLWRHLDAIRDARHLSWRDMAKMLKLGRNTMAALEGGNRLPAAATIRKLRVFIGLSERAFQDSFCARRK